MRVYVAPVSGGFMANQMQLLCELGKAGVRPDVGMGASGGNLALYIALMADWDSAAIRTVAGTMNDSMIVKPWAPPQLSFLPSAVWGLFKGSLYDRSPSDPFVVAGGAFDFAKATELWTAAFSRVQNKLKLFTNRAPGHTRLTYTSKFIDSLPLTYVSGDYGRLRDIAMASAAVPGVLRPVIINGEEFVDGGVTMASPFTAFQENLRTIAGSEPLHIVHIGCTNTTNPSHEQNSKGIVADSTWAMRQLMEGMSAADINAILTFLYSTPSFRHGTDTVHRKVLAGSVENLRAAVVELDTHRTTVLQLRPNHNRAISYTNFSPEDLLSVMDLTAEFYTIVMYWIAPASASDH